MTPHGSIAREIRQDAPFRSLSQEAVVALFRTTDEVRRYFSQIIEQTGLTLQQYNVLRILRGAGDRGLPTLELAERMLERAPGTTRLVDRLTAKGWVARRRCTVDRRVVYCVITPAGRELVDVLDTPVDRADAAAFGGLDEPGLRRLIDALDAVRARVRTLPGGSVEAETVA